MKSLHQQLTTDFYQEKILYGREQYKSIKQQTFHDQIVFTIMLEYLTEFQRITSNSTKKIFFKSLLINLFYRMRTILTPKLDRLTK